ncbi:hypothetical protein Rcae01_06483 [Novipirellula caenicola]|uniref:Uncharacterized protein n=1 Tax=Novipirellula caenicola TaxID=1536901 RepID=A0ABP9W1K2_9BACT
MLAPALAVVIDCAARVTVPVPVVVKVPASVMVSFAPRLMLTLAANDIALRVSESALVPPLIVNEVKLVVLIVVFSNVEPERMRLLPDCVSIASVLSTNEGRLKIALVAVPVLVIGSRPV